MSQCIVICDSEKSYACHLMEYLESCSSIPCEVRVCLGRESLLDNIDPKECLLVVAAESQFSPCISQSGFEHVLVLSETGHRPEGVTSVSKYQSMSHIAAFIAEACGLAEIAASTALRHSAPMKIIGFYTPATRCLQTTLALTAGQILSEMGSALYMNFEAFSGLEILLGEPCRGSMSDLVYYNDCARERLGVQLEYMTQDLNGLRYLSPMRSAKELHSVTGTQWEKLILAIGEITEYQWLLLDLTEHADGFLDLLRMCGRICMIERRDGFSQARVKQYENLLQELDYEDLFVKTMRMYLPVFRELPASLRDLKRGALADYVRGLIDGGELLDF